MKFVFLLPDGFSPRGGVRRVMDYAELLGRRGHSCVVVSKDPKLPAWLDASKYSHFRIRHTSNPYYSVTCDVAWATGKRGALRLRKMRRSRLKIYSVVMLESLNRPSHRSDSDRMLADPYEQNWLYVANSSWLRDAVVEKEQRCALVLASPRSDIFHPDAEPSDKGRHPIVMCLQSRGQWKGSERSVAAIEHMKAKWHSRRTKIETRIFGPGKRPDFGRPLRKLGIVGVHELPVQYAAADVVLHSSAFEGWANIPFEALCCGTPFVTFDTLGIRDFAVDGYNCRIVPSFDTNAMGEAALEILLDRKFREKLQRGCIETFKRFCMIDTVTDIEKIVVDELARLDSSKEGRL